MGHERDEFKGGFARAGVGTFDVIGGFPDTGNTRFIVAEAILKTVWVSITSQK